MAFLTLHLAIIINWEACEVPVKTSFAPSATIQEWDLTLPTCCPGHLLEDAYPGLINSLA